jgi:hypothetical protein
MPDNTDTLNRKLEALASVWESSANGAGGEWCYVGTVLKECAAELRAILADPVPEEPSTNKE